MTLLLIIILVLILYIIFVLNKIIYLKKRVDRSASVVDVYLKKRFDLIPNLIEVVKGYVNYENKTLQEITKLRNSFNDTNDRTSEAKLNEHYKKLLGIVENYPNLKAGEQFLNLQKSLSKVESEISAARRIYINDITTYNTKIESFPSSLMAHLFNFKKVDLPNYESENVNINFTNGGLK